MMTPYTISPKKAETHPELTAHTFVGFDKSVLVVHHDAVLIFTFGVISKGYRYAFVLR